jgi:DNA-binding transcriptional regulator LsrR (DeoR family)
MSDRERLPVDEQFVLCTWSVQAVAADLGISFDDAVELLEKAYEQGRVQILGNDYFTGVQVDGRWVVVEGRARLTLATREWQTLRAMERQLDA